MCACIGSVFPDLLFLPPLLCWQKKKRWSTPGLYHKPEHFLFSRHRNWNSIKGEERWSKTSLVTFGFWQGFGSNVRNEIPLVGARAVGLCTVEWHEGRGGDTENPRSDGSNPDPPYQCRPLWGCVCILASRGASFWGGSVPRDWTSKTAPGSGHHPFFHYQELCAYLRGHTWLPSPPRIRQNAPPSPSARGAKCCVIWV